MGVEEKAENRPRTSRIFLSYARVDRPQVAVIATALEAEGFEVWWDALIDGGAAFSRAIAEALEASTVVIVVWSKTSVESDWVLDEAMHGRDLKKLIPLTIDGVHAPLGFRQYQTIDLSAWRGDRGASAWSELLRAVAGLASGSRTRSSAFSPHGPKAAAVDAADGAGPGDWTPTYPHAGSAGSAQANPDSRATARFTRRLFLAGGAGAGLAVAGFFAWRWSRGMSVSPHSLAVLPFQNLSADASQAFFSEGLTEEMRLAFSRDSQLQVAARTSSNVFRDRHENAESIASKLHVAYLLDGSVRRDADTVRIGISLIDAATGFNRWSSTFDRALADVFALQSEIATTVVKRISAQLSPPNTIIGGTTNLAAFDAYLRGQELYRADAGEQSDREALSSFEAAIADDPSYAGAHAARSKSLLLIAQQYAHADALAGLYAEAETEARRAISIAPSYPDAYIALAKLEFGGRLNVRAARDPYERAHKLGAGDATVLTAVAFYYAQTGRAVEAQAAISQAMTLDPLNANTVRTAGWVAYAAKRYEDAISLLQRALQINPKISNAHASVGDASLFLGLIGQARQAYAAEPAGMFRFTGIAITEYRLGNAAAAASANEQLVSQYGDNALYQQAQVLAQWGHKDAAVEALLRAQGVGDAGLLYLHTDPLLNPLRTDPRMARLQQELGFN
jgi:TolB-like protein/Tfp pilus assembly protein PilF